MKRRVTRDPDPDPEPRPAGHRPRVGFLFNHDQIHQVAHGLPIALAMAEHFASVEVVVATTNARLAAEVERLCAGRAGAGLIDFVDLRLRSAGSRLAARLLDRLLPAAKLAIYRDNLDFFASLDALVVTEKTSLLLKTRYRMDGLRIIHTRHGAGDRAIGFDKASAGFDQVLVSGANIARRLVADAGVAAERIDIVGYPKFDLAGEAPAGPSFPDPGRPTILYNPHPSPHLSSWFRDGPAVLDYFVDHPHYNLIFAPHMMLFERSFTLTVDRLTIDRPGRIEPRWRDAANIHIDLGSRASTDMSYTMAADLYLGDASSQVYEFLLRPRPCIFLNSHHVAHDGDPSFDHWRTGEVIERVDQLGPAIERAIASPGAYRGVQQAMFADRFDLDQRPSALRAATAIIARMPGVSTR